MLIGSQRIFHVHEPQLLVYSDQDKISELLALILWRNLDTSTVNSLLTPLLRLRQACIHPQMVRGPFFTVKPLSKTLTIEKLLKRSQVECEEAQRLRVTAVIGLATLDTIKKEYDQCYNISERKLLIAAIRETVNVK